MGPIVPKEAESGREAGWRRLLAGSFWTGIALVFSQGSTLLGNLAAARLLNPEAFGAYAAGLATVQLGSTLLILGLGYTATKYTAELRGRNPDRAGRVLGTCLSAVCGLAAGGSALLFMVAPLIARLAFDRPELTSLLRQASFALLFATVNLGLNGGLAGLSAFRSMGRLGVWSGAVYLTLVIVGLLVGGERGAVVSIGIAAGVQSVLGWRLLSLEAHRQGIPLRIGLAAEDRSIWMRFGLPGALSGLTASPALWLVQAAILRQPDGLVELGRYLVASNLAVAVLLLPNIINGVGTALFNEQRGADDATGFAQLFRDNLSATILSTLAAAGAVGVGGPLLLGVFGSEFHKAYPVLLVLLGATVPEALTIAFNQVLQTRGKMWHALACINLPRDLLMPILAWNLAPQLGGLGGAVACGGARLIAAVSIVLLVRHLGISHVDGRRR
jgi:O-antigen/teichoic acid export membrane protein